MAAKFIESCGQALFAYRPTAIGGINAPTFFDVGSFPNGGSITADSSVLAVDTVRTLKFTNGTPAAGAQTGSSNNSCVTPGRLSLYSRLEVLAAAGSLVVSARPTFFLNILVLDTGAVRVTSGANTLATSSAGLVSANQWNRYSMAWTITSTTVYSFKVWLNGVEIISVTNGLTLTATANTFIQVGAGTAMGDATSAWLAHVYVDDVNALIDPGDVRVTAKLPTTTISNAWTSTIGTGAIDERPISESNGKSELGGTALTQTYNVQAQSVGDFDISSYTIVSHCGWVWARTDAGTPTATFVYDGANNPITLAATSAAYMSPMITAETMPVSIGMTSTGTAADTFMYEAGSVVAYLPGPGAASGDILYPGLDVGVNVWTTDTGATSNLYQSIDEVSPSDADYIQSPTAPVASQYYETALQTHSDPMSSSGHVVHYRYQKNLSGGVIDLSANLFQGNGQVLTTAQAGFESGLADWTSTGNNTIAQTSAQAHSGTFSLQTTGTGGGVSRAAIPSGTSGRPVNPSTQYLASAWVRTAVTSRSVDVVVRWYNSGGGFISSSTSATVADSSAAWTQVSGLFTSPATAAFATIEVEIFGTILNEVHYIDDVLLGGPIAFWNHTNISNSWTTQNQSLTAAQADQITDYGDLRLRFIPLLVTNENVPTKVADRATANSNATVTTVDLAVTGLTVGNYLIIRSAANNAGGGGAAVSFTLSNQVGTPIDTATDVTFQQNNDPGAANAGVTNNVGVAKITATSGTVRITYGAAVVQACVAEEWSGIHATTPIVGTPVGANGVASTNLASVTDASVAFGNVAYGAEAVEGPTSDTYTQDADTTNGSWVGLTKLGTSNATATDNMTVFGGYKTVTATGAQTYNPTINNARDSAGLILELNAAPSALRDQVSWANLELPSAAAVTRIFGAQVGLYVSPSTTPVSFGAGGM